MHKHIRINGFNISPLVAFLVLLVLAFCYIFSSNNIPSCKDCNLILISIDTLRADHMGVYGYKKGTTPNIDKWARGANIFTNVRTVVPVTFPSFFALMTGHNPLQADIYNNFGNSYNSRLIIKNSAIDNKYKTLAQTLEQSGYKTSAFVTNSALDPELDDINKGFQGFNFFKTDPYAQKKDKKEYTEFIRQALPWLDENKNKKFFLWIHLIGPHAPYVPPVESICKLNQDLCAVASKLDYYNIEIERESLEKCQDYPIPSSKLQFFQLLYDSEISFDDKLVGEILKKIDSLKLDKKTIIVFYGDHGEGFDHNYYFYHSDALYDSAIKIPFIIKIPGSSGQVNKKLIDNTEISNSLLELLSIDNRRVSSNSLFRTAPFKTNSYNDYVFSSNVDASKFSIQNSVYKYIYSLPQTCLYNNQVEELYNLIQDPQEIHNVAKKNPKIVADMKGKLFIYMKKYGQPKQKSTASAESGEEEKQKIIKILKSIGY